MLTDGEVTERSRW